MKRLLILTLLALGLNCHGALFSETSLQYLRGQDYLLGSAERNYFTLEHFSAHGLGDFFFFFDVQEPFRDNTSIYGEAVANWSARKIFFGGEGGFGFVKDISLAMSLEFNATGAYLVGLTFDLAVPKFTVFRLTPLFRDKKGASGGSFQLTWVWALPFELAHTGWLFEGFMDYALGDRGNSATLLTQPRLLFDLGRLTHGKQNKLWIGVEYHLWDNKFGIEGVRESVVQGMAKWVI